MLHFLLIESGIQRQRRRLRKVVDQSKRRLKTLFGLARCVIKFFTRHKLICICALLPMSSTKSYAKKGAFFLTKLILYLFRFSPSRRQVKWGQIDVEELINIGNFFRHDLKFVIADTTYIVIER